MNEHLPCYRLFLYVRCQMFDVRVGIKYLQHLLGIEYFSMLDIRYLPGIHIFIFALTLYYSYFIISMSLYLPFIPEHLISTYPINILTHSYKNKHTIPISIYILYYSITISFHHHSIHTPSSTLFIYYLTYLSLSFILSPLIYHSQFYHILFTIYTITILLPHNISFYTFQDKKKKIYLSYILLVYTI